MLAYQVQVQRSILGDWSRPVHFLVHGFLHVDHFSQSLDLALKLFLFFGVQSLNLAEFLNFFLQLLKFLLLIVYNNLKWLKNAFKAWLISLIQSFFVDSLIGPIGFLPHFIQIFFRIFQELANLILEMLFAFFGLFEVFYRFSQKLIWVVDLLLKDQFQAFWMFKITIDIIQLDQYFCVFATQF